MTALSKGAVESLVKFVKGNFLAGRTFYDDDELAQDCTTWLHQVNELRPSDATEQLPVTLLAQEQPTFTPLPPVAHDYGIFDTVLVNRESLVNIATNRYSVPAHLVGFALTARIHPRHIALFHGAAQVALHPRHMGRGQRIVLPEHYEAVFVHKPRARVMVYRDWLLSVAPVVTEYLSLLCRKRYAERDTQICALYALAQQLGTAAFVRCGQSGGGAAGDWRRVYSGVGNGAGAGHAARAARRTSGPALARATTRRGRTPVGRV